LLSKRLTFCPTPTAADRYEIAGIRIVSIPVSGENLFSKGTSRSTHHCLQQIHHQTFRLMMR
jgi:hypothetical protein